MKKNKLIWILGLSVVMASCDVDNELPEIIDENTNTATVTLKTGTADFSKYVAIGAGFTSGFTDGALFEAAQENSFPNILAYKFALAGGGDFKQPLMEDNIGGLLYGGTQIQEPRFYFDTSDPDSPGPSRLDDIPTTEATTSIGGSYNNYGIPGAKSFHFTFAGYATANPYFGRMATSPIITVLDQAVSESPTFFTLSEVGRNDVLGYALDGGAGEDQTGNSDPTTYGDDDITDPNVFTNIFSGMVTALTANGAKGVVSNVPYITSLANFTTVPYNPAPLDEATATLLNAGFAEYNAGLQSASTALAGTGLLTDEEVAERTISFSAGNNAVVIVDEYLTDLGAINSAFAALPKYRQATEDDLLLLASSSFIGTEVNDDPTLINGLSVPLADKWVLTPEEQEAIKTATDAYNVAIKSVTDANDNVVMVDLNSVLNEAATSGTPFDNYSLTADLVTGGLISLDGVHLTSRGYALMANKILEAIDKGFGSNFGEATNGLAKADDYPTNYSISFR